MLRAMLVLVVLGLLASAPMAQEPERSWGWGYDWQEDQIHLAVVWFPYETSEPGRAVPFALGKTFYTPSEVLSFDMLIGTTEGPEAKGWIGLGVTFNPPQLEHLLSAAFDVVRLSDDVNLRFGLAVAQFGDDTEWGLYASAQVRLLEW